MASILIIDDDEALCTALEAVVQGMGYKAASAGTLKKGLAKVQAGGFNVVILDLRLPDGNGLQAMPLIRAAPSCPEVIILTGRGDPDEAELAIRHGAWGFIAKPPTLAKIKLPVQRAVEHHVRKMAREPLLGLKRGDIVGNSRVMLACLETAAQSAAGEANVLITGETGTGKELFARAIHENSGRAGKPFVVVDCAALPDNLAESVLFGHERGAFTSADQRSEGLVRQADGGTLFLDEVGELPLGLQKSFLRVLQDHRYRPVGGAREMHSDFRLVAATNKDLDKMAAAFEFRTDLLFRLRTVSLALPALRERMEDVKELCYHFMEGYCALRRVPRKGFAPEFLDALAEYDWPGNVRELFHALENAILAAEGDSFLYPRHLPVDIRARLARRSLRGAELAGDGPLIRLDPKAFPALAGFRRDVLRQAEGQYLRELMAVSGWDLARAREIAGLSRARLYAMLKEHGVRR
jgi:two-component system NtrC family response regulator